MVAQRRQIRAGFGGAARVAPQRNDEGPGGRLDSPSTAVVLQGWFNSAETVPVNLQPTAGNYGNGEVLAIANWIQNKNNNSTSIKGRMPVFTAVPANHINRPYQWDVAYHLDLTNHSHGGIETPHTHVSTHVDNIGLTTYQIPSAGLGATNGPNLGPFFAPWTEVVYAMNQGSLHNDTATKLQAAIQTWTEANAAKRFDPQPLEQDEASFDLGLLS